jgi:hypothetical protein
MTEQELAQLAGSYDRMLDLGEQERQLQLKAQSRSKSRQQVLNRCQKNIKFTPKDEDEDEPCTICMEDFAKGEKLKALKVCGHYFHATCIGEWLKADVKATCPNCRASVLDYAS